MGKRKSADCLSVTASESIPDTWGTDHSGKDTGVEVVWRAAWIVTGAGREAGIRVAVDSWTPGR